MDSRRSHPEPYRFHSPLRARRLGACPLLPAISLICAAWLSGCASDPAAVEDRSIGEPLPRRVNDSQPPRAVPIPSGNYRVVRGDTLYSIAFKRGLDFRDVGNWNGIPPPYKIYVGQELRFTPPPGYSPNALPPAASVAPIAVAPAALPPVASTVSPASSAPKNTGMFEDVPSGPAAAAAPASSAPKLTSPAAVAVAPSSLAATATPAAAAALPAAKAPVDDTPSPPALPTRPAIESAASNVNGIAWRWPNGGKVIGGFVAGDQTKQGVDIAGASGDQVSAAADGEVVYSGNGLLGYGELIIVKHNASFLSAYGHNRKRLVQEGDKVRAGQQIAEMGSSASSRDELHFEIRKNGKPVNPLDYLPAR